MGTPPPHILALDDESDLRKLLQGYLGLQDSRVSAVARQVRQICQVPILILSGESGEADRFMVLELAADDCMVKPFSPRELLVQIRAVLRRSQTSGAPDFNDTEVRGFRFAGWELNLRMRRLTSAEGYPIALTNSEFSLLCAFVTAPQRVLSRERLLERSRLHSLEVCERSVDVTILRLRRKIESDPSHPRLLTTERGAGYIFNCTVSVLAS
jgi:DNA-binding response OmpR family regulator